MKGKLIYAVPVSDNETLLAGSEVEIIGKSDMYYLCRIGNGNEVPIAKGSILVTDFSPVIDWEQRRYEIAKDVLACRSTTNAIRIDDAVHQAVRCADALINRLKGE